MRKPSAPARIDCNILNAVNLVANRAGHWHLLNRRLPKLLTFIGAIGSEGAVYSTLENQIACRRQNTAATSLRIRHAPPFLLYDRIPSGEPCFIILCSIIRRCLARKIIAGGGNAQLAHIARRLLEIRVD